MRSSKYEAVERALLVQQVHAENTPVCGSLMIEKANKLAKDLNIKFTATSGWLDRFKLFSKNMWIV